MKSREESEKEMRDLGWWYQHFELPNGLRTGNGQEPGYDAATRWSLMAPFVPQDLTGRTVLDLGGNAGYFSIQMKLRGAKRCVLVDPFQEFIRQAAFAARQFDVELELVCEDAHTFCLTTEERFDYVLFLGLLYHLKYPGLVLDRLAEMTKERIFIQSNIVGEETDFTSQADYERFKDDPLVEDPVFPKCAFVEEKYNGDPTNWWLPNYQALAAMVRSAGLKILARPHPHVVIAEPEVYFGKVVLPKLVFPRYGKRGESVYPGPQKYDKELWDSLIARSRKTQE
ncbi:MAG: methyltransferase domain-containing protein [Acidobacteriota bacterium]